jgi:hypothetical protein
MPLAALSLTLAELPPQPPTFGAGATVRNVPIPYETQLLTEWCWAACATMVAINQTTQCGIGRTKFPGAPCPPTSNENFPATPYDIRVALKKAGRIPTEINAAPPLTALQIDTDLAGGRPLPVGWERPCSGHVIVVCGSQPDATGATVYVVNDPDATTGGAHLLLSWRDLDTARGLGQWTYAWRL